jgi:hypothetical protein
MINLEAVRGVKEVNVRKTKRSFGPGTLPYLRARANELVAGPEYLLTRSSDEETIFECTFRRIIRVPNRYVRSWAIFAPANEREGSGESATAVRVSQWHTDFDLRSEIWKTKDEPSVESQLGVFINSVEATFGSLRELDRMLEAGVRLELLAGSTAWEEQILERTFASGTLHLTTVRDIGNKSLQQLVQDICERVESFFGEPNETAAIDSIDVVFSGS